MFKYFIALFKIGFYLIFAYPKVVYYDRHKDKIPYEKRRKFAVKVLNKLNYGFNCVYEVKGLENIPEGNNIVFTPNHQAVLDPLCMTLVDKPITIIAKKETRDMPYVGRVANIWGSLFMDREDMRQSLQIMKQCSNELANGSNMLIFLEGTRSKDENFKMGEFKPGGLKPAFQNHSTIVPVALNGYYRVLSKKFPKPGFHIQVTFLKPIPYEEYKDENTISLAPKLEKIVEEEVIKLQANDKGHIKKI